MTPAVRNLLVDVLKGILILLVLGGHAIQYGSGAEFLSTQRFYDNLAFRFIYSFHMPLFMAVAGYLSYFSLQKHGVSLYISRRWLKLFPPILAWATGLFLLFGAVRHFSFEPARLIKNILTTFWFLWALLIAGTLSALLETYLSGWRKAGAYMLLVAVSCITPDGYNWESYKFMFPCFVAGYYTARYKLYAYFKQIGWAGISGVLWLALMPFFQKNAYIYTSGFSLSDAQLPLQTQACLDVLRYVIALAASVCVVSLTNFMVRKSKGLSAFFAYCGQHSLAIYILSTYQFVYILPYFTQDVSPNLGLNVLETLGMLAVCLGIRKLLSYNQFLSHMVIGEK